MQAVQTSAAQRAIDVEPENRLLAVDAAVEPQPVAEVPDPNEVDPFRGDRIRHGALFDPVDAVGRDLDLAHESGRSAGKPFYGHEKDALAGPAAFVGIGLEILVEIILDLQM